MSYKLYARLCITLIIILIISISSKAESISSPSQFDYQQISSFLHEHTDFFDAPKSVFQIFVSKENKENIPEIVKRIEEIVKQQTGKNPKGKIKIDTINWKEAMEDGSQEAEILLQKTTDSKEQQKLLEQNEPSISDEALSDPVKRQSVFKDAVKNFIVKSSIAGKKGLIAIPESIYKEAKFLGSSIVKAATLPTSAEIVQGALSGSIPLILMELPWIHASAGSNTAKIFRAAGIGLTFAFVAFHKLFITSWYKFQDQIHKMRFQKAKIQTIYQNVVNFFYGQANNLMFRFIAFNANDGKVEHPITIDFFSKSLMSGLIANYMDSRTHQVINEMHRNGMLSSAARAFIGQWFYLLANLLETGFLGIGYEKTFALVYVIHLAGNAALIYYSQHATKPPVIRLVENRIAKSKVFKNLYCDEFTESIGDMFHLQFSRANN